MTARKFKWAKIATTALLATTLGWSLSRTSAQDTDPQPEPYFRVVEDTENDTIRLELAVRLFTPADDKKPGPTIAYLGAIHIADSDFYVKLQEYLDNQDLVLYEGVKPTSFGTLDADENTTDEAKRQHTETRIRFLATMLERTKSPEAGYVKSLAALTDLITEKVGRRVGEWVESSQNDAWGTPYDFQTYEDGQSFTLQSYAADKKLGGTGPNADLAFADQDPLDDGETGSDPGIQTRMAKALGLTFQLDQMNEDKPHYRNVDMSIDEIEAAIAVEGGDASFIFGMLDGSSIMASVMKFGFAIIEKSPMLQALTKVTLMETMKAVGENGIGQMKGMPENMAVVFEVIINKRNQVVIDEIKTILEAQQFDEDDTIAVIYGAGHLDDLEIQLARQCGYQPTGGFWLTAITVNIKESGLTSEQIKLIRYLISQMN